MVSSSPQGVKIKALCGETRHQNFLRRCSRALKYLRRACRSPSTWTPVEARALARLLSCGPPRLSRAHSTRACQANFNHSDDDVRYRCGAYLVREQVLQDLSSALNCRTPFDAATSNFAAFAAAATAGTSDAATSHLLRLPLPQQSARMTPQRLWYNEPKSQNPSRSENPDPSRSCKGYL